MSIVDVLPTIMAAIGLPVLPDFDGDVRTDLLSKDPEIRVRGPDDVPEPRMKDESESEAAARNAVVEDRLADLGYME
jgi:hypothetical protein